jgi:thioesterase domain-containing protein
MSIVGTTTRPAGTSLPQPPPAGGGAPRDALEDALVGIWQEVLGVTSVGIHDDFFDLGGHSVLAAEMAARVGAAFDLDVPVSLLLENPSLARFADALVSASRPEGSGILAIQTDGERPPLFFLHGDLNGGGLYCARLARGLHSQPFYAIDPLGVTGGTGPASIESMAAEHAAAIRRIRPRGPYLLGGHCNGALEALEIARQFRASGEQVAALTLVQPAPVDRRFASLDGFVRRVARAARLTEDRRVDAFLRAREAAIEMSRQPRAIPRVAVGLLSTLLRAGAKRPDGGSPARADETFAPRHNEVIWSRYTRALEAYVPRPYDGPAAIFVAEAAQNTPADPTPTWRHLGPRAQFQVVPGGHLSCITSEVGTTAAAIDAYIAGALRGNRL